VADELYTRFAAELAKIQARVRDIEKGTRSPQLGNASLDMGSGRGYIPIRDNGVERGRIGRMPDGTVNFVSVNNPTAPPTPVYPQVEPLFAGLKVTVYGIEGEQPHDFSHVRIYCDGIRVGHISQLPGSFIISPLSYTNHTIYVTAVNLSGQESAETTPYVIMAPNQVVGADVTNGIIDALKIADAAVTEAKVAVAAITNTKIAGLSIDVTKLQDGSVEASKILDGTITEDKLAFTIDDLVSLASYFQDAAPTGTIKTGALWVDSNDSNKLYRYNGTSWIAATNTDIATALSNASTAQTNAAAAVLAASTAQATADGKVDIFYQTTEPSSGMSTGDLWIDTDDSNKLYRYSGSAWVLSADQRIATAIANAATAQSTADGKITAFYQTTAPSSGMHTGDLWYDTDNGNKVSRYNGSTWTALLSGTDAIADDAIVTSKIAAAQVVATTIAANAVIAGKIAAGTITTADIAALTIQAGNIAADAIAAGKIAADAITAREIQALAITAGKLAANSVTAGAIAAGSITADKLAAELILASKIIVGDPLDWHLEIGDPNGINPLLWWNNQDTGLALTRDPTTNESNVFISGRMQFGSGSQIDSDIIDLLELPSTGFQTPKVRQQRTWIQSAPSKPITPYYQNPTLKGNLIIMTVYQLGTTGAPTCNTPSGATLVYSFVSGFNRLSMFIVPNPPSSRTSEGFDAGPTHTCSWAITLSEYQGIQATAFDVASTGASGTSTTASTGTSGTSTYTNELQIAVLGSASNNGIFTSPTNSFKQTIASGSGAGFGTALFSKTVTSTGTTSMSAGTANSAWMGLIATFRIAPAATVPNAPPTDTVRFYTQRRSGVSTPHIIEPNGTIYPIARKPLAKVYCTAGFLNSANTDVYAQTAWAISTDTDNMVAISTGVGFYSSITVPLTGFYDIDFLTLWQQSSNTTAAIVCYVTKNSRTVGASVARGSAKFVQDGSDGSPVRAQRRWPLTAGDILYWGNWSSVNANVLTDANNNRTEITVSYYGPS
jgi:hypothetical protein